MLRIGRFSPEYHNHHLYVQRYWHPQVFSSIHMLLDAAKSEGCSATSIAIRWLLLHSRMRAGDAIVIGASSLDQLLENLECAKQEPLTEATVQVANQIADLVRPVEAQYFRGYDKQHGRADKFLDSIL